MNNLLLLKKVSLFQNLSQEELLLIDSALVTEYYVAGETIFREGSLGKDLYIIAEGRVRILKEMRDGKQRELTCLSVGDNFGEMALFDDFPRSASVVAAGDCTLLKLDKNSLFSLIIQRPQIVLEFCRELSQRLRNTASRQQ